MALYTDGLINSAADLVIYESGLLEMASTEGVDVSAKSALAASEMETQITQFLLRKFERDPHAPRRRALGVADVAVTPPLKRWHAYATLAGMYRDAYNNQLNDRYKGKWAEYQELANTSAQAFLGIGVGLVLDPLPKPGMPALASVAGAASGISVFVRICWINARMQESSPSEAAYWTTTDGMVLAVTAPLSPANAMGWNVYAGSAADNTTLQNAAALTIGQTWAATTGISYAGRAPADGQSAEFFIVNDHVLRRG